MIGNDRSIRRSLRVLLVAVGVTVWTVSGLNAQQIPHPRDVLGFTPGDDYRIADFPQLQAYFDTLAATSPRVRLSSAGKTRGGNDILVAVITSEENHARLERYQTIARQLARARGVTDEAARALAAEGRAIVWIDAGLHAAEMAHAQHAMLLAHHMATDESSETRQIRDEVVLVLLPCVNPDGLDLVADWYRRTVHTPHQDSPMPWLFNEYSGYENNRDFFMQTQEETKILSRLLYEEWLPQVMYNHHQGFYPTRIFVPPFPDPFNPNIDPGVIRGIELVGAVMQHRFEREGKDGVISRYGFSSWYNGSARTTTYFHNMVGILTETTHDTPSPFLYDPAKLPERFGNGWSTREPSTNYTRPWRGGTLRFRDAIDYMLTGSMGVLEASATFREKLLFGMYQMGARQVALGETVSPVAYVIPPDQHDPQTATRFIEILMRGGVEVHRAMSPFTADGARYGSGSFIIRMAQPFRPYVKDLLEPQRYPDIRHYAGGPPVPPYDNAGWTLSYQMGVHTVAIDRPFDAALVALDAFPVETGRVTNGAASYGLVVDPRHNNAVIAVNRLLGDRADVSRADHAIITGRDTIPAGGFIVRTPHDRARLAEMAPTLGLRVHGLDRAPGAVRRVSRSRVGVYQSWVVEWVDGWTAAEGWTRFVLDEFEFPYVRIVNADIRHGDLRSRFDALVIPNQGVDDIVNGYRPGRRQFGEAHQNLPPPEYQGGIGAEGVAALRSFVNDGGTLILIDRSTDLAIDYLDVPVTNILRDLPEHEFFGPGSIVRLTTDVTNPLGYGMQKTGVAYFRKSRAFTSNDPAVVTIARYGQQPLLMSGWLLGEEHLAGEDAVVQVPKGRGRIIMFGFPVYFRAWPHATFKFFFNALLTHDPPTGRAGLN